MTQLTFKLSCWNCKKAREDPNEIYACPNYPQHWQEYDKPTW